MRLLLIEDDTMIGESVLDLLREEGYAVDWVQDGDIAISVLEHENYDLIVLDLGLPNCDGLTVLKILRDRKDRTPILVATAHDAIPERIEVLDTGADDYIVKPYDLGEMLARIRSLIRRSMGRAEPAYECSGVRIDPANRIVTVEGNIVVVSAREWAILELLLARPGSVLSRKQLEERLYGWKDSVSSNAIEVHIHSLRRKIGVDLIQNVRGVGYMISKGNT